MSTISPVPHDHPTFLGLPGLTDPHDLSDLGADIAIIGLPYGVPYSADQPSGSAPAAIRAASSRYHRFLDSHDADLGGPLLNQRDLRVLDCGNVAMTEGAHEANAISTTALLGSLFAQGIVPIVLGGDHSTPIPVMRAFPPEAHICVVQLDAHLDFRAEVNGVTDGRSSVMRRASELPNVTDIVQIGLRGMGSARPQDYADASEWGTVQITDRELRRAGIDAAIERIPAADHYYLTIDIDGLDPAIAPGVLAPAFGGLTYGDALDLIQGMAAKGSIIGADIVEVVPSLDVRHLTSTLAARLATVLIGTLARSS